MNIGVYVAAGPNPIFLRLFMAQIARQTALPQFLAIYENGNKTSAFDWACGEIVSELRSKGVKILYVHSPRAANSVTRYYEPLKMLLYTSETDIFLKMDIDDFYTDGYIEHTSSILEDHDIAINQNCGIALVRPFHGDFKFKESVVMKYSPMGAAPSHVVFNRRFGNKYLGLLAGSLPRDNAADDDLMAECMVGMTVSRVDGPANYIYVSHGNNHSSYAWQNTGGRIYLD